MWKWIIVFVVACLLMGCNANTAIPQPTISPATATLIPATSTFVSTLTVAIPTLAPTATMIQNCPIYSNDQAVFLDSLPNFAVRNGPGCEYAEQTEPLIKDDPTKWFPLLGQQGAWLLVDLCGGRQAWIFAPSVAGMNLNTIPEQLPAIAAPPTQATPSPAMSALSEAEALRQATDTLITFFDDLHDQEYAEAAEIFSGGYGILINWNSKVDPNDQAALLQRGCEWNGFMCFLRIKQIISAEQVSPQEYRFVVELVNEEGRLFQGRGPNDTQITQFTMSVVRDCDGRFMVVTWPFYEQYGG